MANSPLGKYGAIVAAIIAIGVIGAYLVAVLVGNADASNLKDFALIAIGAVFGSAAGVNGWKRDAVAINARLDKMAVPPAADG